MTDTDVLIVGAGPTGLTLALMLAKRGVRIRIVDESAGPGTTSRALVVHSRTLEFFRQAGIAKTMVAAGTKVDGLNFWVNRRSAARLRFDDIGVPFGAFPFVLVYPQDKLEALLVGQLAALGVSVERGAKFVAFERLDGDVNARIHRADGTVELCHARFVAGCDGTHSAVRAQLRTGFPGGDYGELFYVADITGTGPTFNGQVHIAFDDADFVAIFPMKEPGSARLVGAARPEDHGIPARAAETLRWEDVSKRPIEHLKLSVSSVRWFSTYHVHHRVASAFRHGPAFLLGDAAHIHSPVGGQGMNTGIGDAVNLAWKLAGVLQRRIDPAVLDSYQTERIAFARRLVATTDRAFELVTARGGFARRIRIFVAPLAIALVFSVRAFRRYVFRTVSQVGIRYPDSWLSSGVAGGVHGGDRLPWVEWRDSDGNCADNYQYFSSLDWQLHCYGDVSAEMRELCDSRGVALHVFAWRMEMKRAGLREHAVYLVRPDEHVAFADPNGEARALQRYLDRIGFVHEQPGALAVSGGASALAHRS